MKINFLSNANILGTTVLSVIALMNKEISVFYMLYLFWWQALIEIFSGAIMRYKNQNNFKGILKSLYHSLFLMGIYFVFIIVLFGFVFSFSNQDLFILNGEVLFFQNTSFNLNLLWTLALAVVAIYNNSETPENGFGVFSNKMIVLHISIILGAVLHFGIRHYFPETFGNSMLPFIISAVPFLILKTLLEYINTKLKN